MLSPSSRRAWIEIGHLLAQHDRPGVALLAEGVDRNIKETFGAVDAYVALLAEGVDRNIKETFGDVDAYVALLAEGVDRNIEDSYACRKGKGSPSSRRAWIEIVQIVQ